MIYNFDVNEAVKYGINEAIIIYNFKFWIMKNKANSNNSYDGRTWTYNSIKAFTILFPFWSKGQIDRILKSLVEQEVLITGNYNKTAYDHTIWYAFKDESIFLNQELDFSKTGNQIPENGKPIPDINTDIKTNNVLSFSEKEKTLIKRSDLFDLFWKRYGKSIGKQNTIKYWNKLSEEERIKAIDSVDIYTEGGKKEVKFRKDPERYIRDKIFLDILEQETSTNIFKDAPKMKSEFYVDPEVEELKKKMK